MYKTLATYKISPGLSLFLVRGSVIHFEGKTDKAAIVNAANQGCLGGGGVDGAISAAGGARLMEDRLRLPVLERRGEYEIRCHVGSAVCTGPGDYDDLQVSYVLHAVGPNYHNFEEDSYDQAHELLKSAYSTTLDVASESRIQEVGFSLLSAGIFRGSCTLEQVLRLGIKSILSWGIHKPDDTSVSDIHLFAFTERECKTLKKICDQAFGIDSDETLDSSEEIPHTDEKEKVESDHVTDEKMEENDDTETKQIDIEIMAKKSKEAKKVGRELGVDEKIEEDDVMEKKLVENDTLEKKAEKKSVALDQKTVGMKDNNGSNEKGKVSNSNVDVKADENAAKGEESYDVEAPKKQDVGELSYSTADDSGAVENDSVEKKKEE